MAIDTKQFESMQYRFIGPHRGGRVIAVCGVAQDRDTYYFGSTGAGSGGRTMSERAGELGHNLAGDQSLPRRNSPGTTAAVNDTGPGGSVR